MITADDYGYRPGVRRRHRARRACRGPRPRLGHGNARFRPGRAARDRRRHRPPSRARAVRSPSRCAASSRLIGRPPQFIDGHRHCHAEPRMALAVIPIARELGCPGAGDQPAASSAAPQRGSADDRPPRRAHVRTPRRAAAGDRALAQSGERSSAGTTEWVVHPGYRDPESGSSYDAGRPEDLALLLELGDRDRWRAAGIERSALPSSRSRAPSTSPQACGAFASAAARSRRAPRATPPGRPQARRDPGARRSRR